MNAFLQLSDSSLIRLIEAIEAGELPAGNRLELANHLNAAEIDAVDAELESLISGGMSHPHLTYVLRTVVMARHVHTLNSAKVELVWTGPEHNSATRDTAVVVRELFASARESVLVAGFAVHRGREIFRVLADRMAEKPELQVRMFLNIARQIRDTTVEEQLIGRFVRDFRREHWSGERYPVIYYDPRALAMHEKSRTSLHAKCVVVDNSTSLVTSANFTEAAQERNIEVGTLVHDEIFSKSLVAQFDTLVRAGAVQRLPLG